jgi:hypothetical protein
MVFGDDSSVDAVADEDEAAVLEAALAVVTTSTWTRRLLLDRYWLPPGRVHVAQPGTEPAPGAAPAGRGTADG